MCVHAPLAALCAQQSTRRRCKLLSVALRKFPLRTINYAYHRPFLILSWKPLARRQANLWLPGL